MERRPFHPYTLLLAACLAACSRDTTAPLVGAWSHVAAGDRFTCALDTQGAAWCWGSGSFGQLGNNHTTASLAAVPVFGGHVFTSIVAGNDHACAVTAAGAGWCWGLDDYRELGDSVGRCNGGAPVDCSRVPIQVLGAPPIQSMTVAGFATCALMFNGQAWCWGWNHHGQLGSGSAGDILDHPTPVAGARIFTSLSLDIDHACGISAQQVYCWGSNDYGQLGVDSTVLSRCGAGVGFFCALSPVAVASGMLVRNANAGSVNTCAIDQANATWCWGSNEFGELGSTGAGGPLPKAIAAPVTLTQLSAGRDHACGLTLDGTAWCWGVNDYGQVGEVTSPLVCSAFGSALPCEPTPTLVSGLPALSEISAGTSHTCGVARDGAIWCWGRGDFGQLGQGASVSSARPVRVAEP